MPFIGRGAHLTDNQQSTFAHVHASSSHSTTSPWSPIPHPFYVSTAGTRPGPAEEAEAAVAPAHGRRRHEDGGIGGGDSGGRRRTGQLATVEPAFEFSRLRPLTQYADNSDTFVSLWMLSVVALWLQSVASTKRRRLNADGVDCPGAGESSAEGTNVMPKTWMTRIHTACAFADIIGRTVCLHDGDERPSDA